MKPLLHVHYKRFPGLEGFEVCQVAGSNHSFPNHFHDDVYAIGLMGQECSYCLGPDREEALVRAGEIALINPGQVHSGVPAGNSCLTYTMLYISAELLRTIARDLAEKDQSFPEFKNVVIRDPSLFANLQVLGASLGSLPDPLEWQGLLTESFCRLLSRYGGVRSAATTGDKKP